MAGSYLPACRYYYRCLKRDIWWVHACAMVSVGFLGGPHYNLYGDNDDTSLLGAQEIEFKAKNNMKLGSKNSKKWLKWLRMLFDI